MAKITLNDITNDLTNDEISDLKRLENRECKFDVDCPEMTYDQLKEFHRINRNKQSVSLRLSPDTMMKAKSLGKGYTSVLSRLLDLAINDEDMLKQCL